jgi:hypothetical protein
MRLQDRLCWYHVKGMLLVALVLLQDKLCWAGCMLLFAAHAQAWLAVELSPGFATTTTLTPGLAWRARAEAWAL